MNNVQGRYPLKPLKKMVLAISFQIKDIKIFKGNPSP
jgi:hypothetical protein